jgi:3-deoxy-alpha-D-manno-octulosonate 8-oxidase
MGGLSLTYSEVGICHAVSYGLSKILGMRHCYSNCIAFNHLSDYYPDGVSEFRKMVEKHNITLPQNLSKDWTEDQITAMAHVSYQLDHMWNHAIGYNWREKITLEDIEEIFRRL